MTSNPTDAGEDQIQDQMCAAIRPLDPDLAAIVDAWPNFPKHIKTTILEHSQSKRSA